MAAIRKLIAIDEEKTVKVTGAIVEEKEDGETDPIKGMKLFGNLGKAVQKKFTGEVQTEEKVWLGKQLATSNEKCEAQAADIHDLKWLLFNHWQVAGYVPLIADITDRQKQLLKESAEFVKMLGFSNEVMLQGMSRYDESSSASKSFMATKHLWVKNKNE